MKAKVKATGEVIDVEPNIYNGKIISWMDVVDNGAIIYSPDDVEVDVSEMQGKMKWVPCPDECGEIKLSEVNWKEVEIRAAYHALSACIMAGKSDAARSAVYHAKQLVEELKR